MSMEYIGKVDAEAGQWSFYIIGAINYLILLIGKFVLNIDKENC